MFIVISGSLVDTPRSGGFEFFGPFWTQDKAEEYRAAITTNEPGHLVPLVVELLRAPGTYDPTKP